MYIEHTPKQDVSSFRRIALANIVSEAVATASVAASAAPSPNTRRHSYAGHEATVAVMGAARNMNGRHRRRNSFNRNVFELRRQTERSAADTDSSPSSLPHEGSDPVAGKEK